jgi:hypothetical protein
MDRTSSSIRTVRPLESKKCACAAEQEGATMDRVLERGRDGDGKEETISVAKMKKPGNAGLPK